MARKVSPTTLSSQGPTGGQPPGSGAIKRFRARTHIAYFSMELAVRSEMHTYCGGLGLLAGDTARACADLEVPVVFVTLLNRKGYFRQEIDRNGRQRERTDDWDVGKWCEPLPTETAVEIRGRPVHIRPWLHLVEGAGGFEIPLIFLDTDLPTNPKFERTLTDFLYGGNASYRLEQEIVLGRGGLRTLRALGFHIGTYHMNEGHASLLTLDLLDEARSLRLERPRPERESGLAEVRRRCVFTTHTPVKAGHDQFDYALVRRLMPSGTDLAALHRWGGRRRLNMTRLGLNLSKYVNGVSRRHAETTRKMFPGYRIHAITNGVHVPTWTHPEFARLYDSKLAGWRMEPELLIRALQLSAEEVWDCHRIGKRELLDRIRESSGLGLDPDVLTIVFARRMTPYKRPWLVFEDTARLTDLASRHPFQLVIAGKAHPRDPVGKGIIRRIHDWIRTLDGQVPCVFLPNYDMDWAKALVAGADVWLQTPRPPLEASGTSGMKAALNGGLNLSILDGWWVEGCIEGVTGWSIDHFEGRGSDQRDAAALYRRLEGEVLPCFYQETDRWRSMMKQSIAHVGSRFNTHRMLRQYAAEAYLP